jgi:ABC-type oligopeptide transport system substrate-binding subunit
MWQDTLGVTVTLKGEDFNTWLSDDAAGNFTATRFAWLDDYPDPQDFLSLLFHTGATYNSQKATIPAADALMDKADVNTNTTERLQQYNQA